MATKKVIFLPFINGDNDTVDGRKWRKDLENVFLHDPNITSLTNAINGVRNPNPNAENDDAYYQELHAKKSIRQHEWLKALSAETAALLENSLNALPDDVKNSDKHIIVAALPEFFWCDIHDNEKHTKRDNAPQTGEYIEGYHKPIYDKNLADCLFAPTNPLAMLTGTYNNLIIFSGTAIWKTINSCDHKNEKIYNTMLIYSSGGVKEVWSKNYFSNIDGFNSTKKEGKKGELGKLVVRDGRTEFVPNHHLTPITEFNGVKFAYDICIDFSVGKNGQPLSKDLLGDQKTDLNILIAYGKRFNANLGININSDVILRCDGYLPPYGQIAKSGSYDLSMIVTSDDEASGKKVNSIRGGTVIGILETEIDTDRQDVPDQDCGCCC